MGHGFNFPTCCDGGGWGERIQTLSRVFGAHKTRRHASPPSSPGRSLCCCFQRLSASFETRDRPILVPPNRAERYTYYTYPRYREKGAHAWMGAWNFIKLVLLEFPWLVNVIGNGTLFPIPLSLPLRGILFASGLCHDMIDS